jgi:alpha-tubulin suppressor-like RCC1 family protein
MTVAFAGDAVQISEADGGWCALDKLGYVTCWASTCGDYMSSAPRRMPIEQVSSISGNCALVGSMREVYCWHSRDGRPGAGDIKDDVCAIHKIRHLKHVKQLASVATYGLALTDEGAVYHWGEYHHGGIRDFGKKFDKRKFPLVFGHYAVPEIGVAHENSAWLHTSRSAQRVASGLKVRALLATEHYTCLELENGEPYCEWLLSQTPFRIQDVWPSARIDSGSGR